MLPETFVDPSRFHGTIYRASNWLCLAPAVTAATLCGMCGYRAMAKSADDLTQRARERFRCRRYPTLKALESGLANKTSSAEHLPTGLC